MMALHAPNIQPMRNVNCSFCNSQHGYFSPGEEKHLAVLPRKERPCEYDAEGAAIASGIPEGSTNARKRLTRFFHFLNLISIPLPSSKNQKKDQSFLTSAATTLSGCYGPASVTPMERPDVEARSAVGQPVVEMVAEPMLLPFVKDAAMSRSDKTAFGRQEASAAAVQ